MAFLQVKNVKVWWVPQLGCPRNIEDNAEIYSKWGNYNDFFSTTGIAHRRNSS